MTHRSLTGNTHPNHQVWSYKAAPHCQAYQGLTLPLKEWGWTQHWIIDSFIAKVHTSRIAGHGVTWLPRIIKHIRVPHFPWRSEVELKKDSSFTAKQHTSRITRYRVTRLPHIVKHIRAPHFPWRSGVDCKTDSSTRSRPSNAHPELPGMESLGCLALLSISEAHTSLEGVRLNARLTHRLVHCQATHIPNHQVRSDKAFPHYQAYQSPTLPLKEWGWMQDWLFDSLTAKQRTSRITGHGVTWLPLYQAYQSPTLPLKD